MNMRVLGLVCALGVAPVSGVADQAEDCLLAADVIGAVQTARLDRVRKKDAAETILAANPEWPEKLTLVLPTLIEHVYGLKKRDLKNADLAEGARASCDTSSEELQGLTDSLSN